MSKKWIVAALGLAGVMAAGVAQAGHGSNVQWSVSIGLPLPVVVVPATTVRYPGYPVVGHGHHYQGHAYQGRYTPTRGDRDRDGIPNQFDRVYNPAWDRDGDGVPNRYDTRYTPRWDRDGDGVPNRYDDRDGRRYDGRYDSDRDGIPNRRDRHPGRPG
ncbi:hypothetical protein HLB44_00855 [Aquincola sp. S2]|uniref:Uncharacterized protein n=1 Tax=Pseudaquabacterium terrae TaxID=2732868 RepID=A0ABX2EAE9_9BURK|nr:hypothetical protein [Aquabacterium terrae]NRF65521.1 hypothetical protein [Aquabacterium terrae]